MSGEHVHSGCHELLDRLSDYIDGELEATLCAELEVHLAGCRNCQVMVDTVRKTITLYHAQSATELPLDVTERLLKALELEQ